MYVWFVGLSIWPGWPLIDGTQVYDWLPFTSASDAGICQHQFCLLEQRTTRDYFPSHQQAMRKTLPWLFCVPQRSNVSLSTLSTARLNLSLQPEEVFELLGYAAHGPWPSQWSCGHMPSEDAGECVDLPLIYCSAGKVSAAAASAVIPTPWTAVGQRILQWLKMQGGIPAAFPSCAGHLTPPQCAVISYRILETPHLQKPPNEKNPQQCGAERGTWTSVCITWFSKIVNVYHLSG